MLIIHPYQINFLKFFHYLMMYILNIRSTIKRIQSKNSKILHLKTITDELDFLTEIVIIQ